MIRIYCDRCGKDTEFNNWNLLTTKDEKEISMNGRILLGESIQADICDKCHKELKKWMKK